MKITVIGAALSALLFAPDADGQWVHSAGPFYTTVRSFQFQGPRIFSGTFGSGVYMSADDGITWETRNLGMTFTDVRSMAAMETILFTGTGGGVYRSIDAGESWIAVDSGLTNWNVQSFAVIGRSLFAGTGGGVFVTSDSGGYWVAVDSGLGKANVTALAAIGTDLYAGTNGGVYCSSNLGAIWTHTNLHVAVNALAVLDTVLFAGVGTWSSGGGVVRTADKGVTWIESSSGLNGRPVQGFTVYRSNLFAASSWVSGGGVSFSTDRGASWALADSGLTEKDVTALGCSGTDLFAGTVVGGIWRRPLSELVTSADRPGAFPTGFSLLQNFPNPFNPLTVIRYGIPFRSRVNLTVFNALGQGVRTLVEEEEEAGFHEVKFDAAGLASGVYFARLSAPGKSATRKLVLAR